MSEQGEWRYEASWASVSGPKTTAPPREDTVRGIYETLGDHLRLATEATGVYGVKRDRLVWLSAMKAARTVAYLLAERLTERVRDAEREERP